MPDYLEIARAWLAENIEGNNWAMPGSTEQVVKPLAELLARVRAGGGQQRGRAMNDENSP